MLSVISLSAVDYIYTPWLDSSTFLPGTFSPSSNINQQAWFPETRNSLSKRKPSNTCTSMKPARTPVKNQAIRLRHCLIVHWKSNFFNILLIYSRSAQHQQSLMSVIDDRYCALQKYMVSIKASDWKKKRISALNKEKERKWFHFTNILQIDTEKYDSSLFVLQSHSSIFWSAVQPTCALTAHKLGAAFSQQELIDWPSMETRSSNESSRRRTIE